MLRNALLAILITLSVSKIRAEVQPNEHVKDMHELAAAIKAKLPEGWKLEMTPFIEGDESKRDWAAKVDPHIVIYGPQAVNARHHRAVSFVQRDDPTPFLMKYRLGPKISQAEWLDIQRKNEKSKELRDFYKNKLDHLRDKRLKRSDYDPENYKPQNDAERELLREYAFVWKDTCPSDLPKYFYNSLSVWPTSVEDYEFNNLEVHKEYIAVAKIVSQLFARYEDAKK